MQPNPIVNGMVKIAGPFYIKRPNDKVALGKALHDLQRAGVRCEIREQPGSHGSGRSHFLWRDAEGYRTDYREAEREGKRGVWTERKPGAVVVNKRRRSHPAVAFGLEVEP